MAFENLGLGNELNLNQHNLNNVNNFCFELRTLFEENNNINNNNVYEIVNNFIFQDHPQLNLMLSIACILFRYITLNNDNGEFANWREPIFQFENVFHNNDENGNVTRFLEELYVFTGHGVFLHNNAQIGN